jgi:hypothetical protein
MVRVDAAHVVCARARARARARAHTHHDPEALAVLLRHIPARSSRRAGRARHLEEHGRVSEQLLLLQRQLLLALHGAVRVGLDREWLEVEDADVEAVRGVEEVVRRAAHAVLLVGRKEVVEGRRGRVEVARPRPRVRLRHARLGNVIRVDAVCERLLLRRVVAGEGGVVRERVVCAAAALARVAQRTLDEVYVRLRARAPTRSKDARHDARLRMRRPASVPSGARA